MKNLAALSNPFSPEDIEWFVGVTNKEKTMGMAIPFITNRAVQDRLDEVCGIDGWKNVYQTLKETDEYDQNGITIGKKTSYLCGISIWSDERGEWITKWDGSDETDIEALKGGLSSAMKRAAVQFGIGRYLYKLESPWVEIEQQGKSWVIKATQQLIIPDWAMPGGNGFPMAGESRQVTVVVGDRPQTGPTGQKLSEKQVNRALAKAKAANMSIEDIKLWTSKKFGIEEIQDLSRQQYDALCDALDKVANNLR